MELENPFMPYLAILKSKDDLTPDVKLLRVELVDADVSRRFDYKPGQFAFLSAFGEGEAPFGIISLPSQQNGLEFAVRRIGTVTRALHELEPGDALGLRGPFGSCFPLHDYAGKHVAIIGGGIGMAPLRPVVNYILQHREDYGQLWVINGARTPQDLLFASECEGWTESPRTALVLTVDRGDEYWTGRVSLVPTVVREIAPPPDNAVAITCGPPIMLRYTFTALKELGFGNDQIVTTLEAKMKCGLGKCARCNLGDKYVCQDGPVFSFDQISQFLEQP